MAVYVALLRAINVGGTGLLPMKDLAALCADLGFTGVRTYIQSGNVVFDSTLPEAEARAALERALAERMGKPVDVIVRSATDLRVLLDGNPFPDAPPAKVAVVFQSTALPADLLDGLVIPGREDVRPGRRELYIHYPDGMGRSKLKLPRSMAAATARNINTVAKLVAMAERDRA